MSTAEPQFWDAWMQVLSFRAMDPVDAASVRATSRVLRAICDLHARVAMDLSHGSRHVAFYRRLPAGNASRDRVTSLVVDPQVCDWFASADLPPSLDGLRYVSDVHCSAPARRVLTDLPRALRKLVIWTPIDGRMAASDVPPSLTCLKMHNCGFETQDVALLPRTLTKLDLGMRFKAPLCAGALPPSLTDFDAGWARWSKQDMRNLPASLTRLSLTILFDGQDGDFSDLPSSLSILKLDYRRFSGTMVTATLPRSLTALELHDMVEGTCESFDTRGLPPGLRKLRMGSSFGGYLDIAGLPRTLLDLNLRSRYDRPFDAAELPPNLRRLELGSHFTHPLEAESLPRSLTDLRLARHYNGVIDVGALPRGMTWLSLGRSPEQTFEASELPPALRDLRCCHEHQRREAAKRGVRLCD